jgi:hypothetical protein
MNAPKYATQGEGRNTKTMGYKISGCGPLSSMGS